MIQIIALTGYAGVGKDTIAECLINQGWYRLAFADKLKELAWDINPVVDEPLGRVSVHLQHFASSLGGTPESPLEAVDLAKKYSAYGREFLQNLGQAVRDHLGPNVWIDLLQHEMSEAYSQGVSKFVITDLRYPNEAEWIDDGASVGGWDSSIIRIVRPGVAPVNSHVSDAGQDALAGHIDYTIDNDGTPQDAADEIIDFLEA